MKFRILVTFVFIFLCVNAVKISAQADTALGQITNSTSESFAGGISGDGRFVVIESRGNIATENPRNTDGNREIFLFDYAQRRIYQITDTKSVLTDTTVSATLNSNIKVEISNLHPVISTDGRWIAFASNATTSMAGTAPNGTNPGGFDGNTTGYPAVLQADGNTEMWLYQVPAVSGADLSSGAEIAAANLSGGTFTQITNSAASAAPTAGTATLTPFVAEDNHDATINDNGSLFAFSSTRNLIPNTANSNTDGNDEIFAYSRTAAALAQITNTTRGTIAKPTYNTNPTISGSGARVMFASTGDNPVIGMTGGTNSDRNEEVFYANLDASTGVPTGTTKGRQVSVTTQTNAGDVVNIISLGARMSRDGRYIGFDSFADIAAENGGTNYSGSFALYVYDTTTATFRRVGPRSDADTAATGGDVPHYPGFTIDDATSQPVLVYQTRLNIKADGTVPATASDGLNSDASRPTQIFTYPLTGTTTNYVRLTRIPAPNYQVSSIQPITSSTLKRLTFNFSYTEVGTGNDDLLSEAYYLLTPTVTTTNPATATANFFTGTSRLAVSPSPVPTPTVTPTPTTTPSPSPTPVTPPAVQGLAPGMLAIVNFDPVTTQTITAQTAAGSISRRFTLPIELSGVSLTVNGTAAGIKSVASNQVTFVVPPQLPANNAPTGTSYPVVINFNGTVTKTTITLVPVRPDIFTNLTTPGPGGRVNAVNATNRVKTREPFTVTTQKLRGGVRVATVLRVYLTGVRVGQGIGTATLRIGDVSLTSATDAVLVEPGVYTVDFLLTPALNAAGDQPAVISLSINGVVYFGRLDDTAPRISIL